MSRATNRSKEIAMLRRRHVRNACWTVSLLLSCPVLADAPAGSWPKFQNGGNPTATAGCLPTEWSPDENIAWRASIEGYGQSTPVVADDLIYVTSVSGEQREQYHLAAFSLSKGEHANKPHAQESKRMTK